jgi:hypothetical protein
MLAHGWAPLVAEPAERETMILWLVDRAGGRERWWPAVLGGAIQAFESEERVGAITSQLGTLAPELALVLLRAAPFEMAIGRSSVATPKLKDEYWRTVQPAGDVRGEELGMSRCSPWIVPSPRSTLPPTSSLMEGETLARLMKALVSPTAEASADVQLHAGRIGDALGGA